MYISGIRNIGIVEYSLQHLSPFEPLLLLCTIVFVLKPVRHFSTHFFQQRMIFLAQFDVLLIESVLEQFFQQFWVIRMDLRNFSRNVVHLWPRFNNLVQSAENKIAQSWLQVLFQSLHAEVNNFWEYIDCLFLLQKFESVA